MHGLPRSVSRPPVPPSVCERAVLPLLSLPALSLSREIPRPSLSSLPPSPPLVVASTDETTRKCQVCARYYSITINYDCFTQNIPRRVRIDSRRRIAVRAFSRSIHFFPTEVSETIFSRSFAFGRNDRKNSRCRSSSLETRSADATYLPPLSLPSRVFVFSEKRSASPSSDERPRTPLLLS